MTNQSPSNPDDSGDNAMGRWDLGAWFWPPMTATTVAHAPIPCGSNGTVLSVGYTYGALCPPNPNPSLVPESFLDTPVVNGTAYPTVSVPQGIYRFRLLNAANDRFFNFSLFYAADKDGNVCKPGYPNPNNLQTTSVVPSSFSACTEVKMVDAVPHRVAVTNANDHLQACSSSTITNGGAGVQGTNGCWPATWPTDGRDGGVPDPSTAGPAFIQIGTEGGVLPAPVVIDPTPVGYNYNRRDVVVLNVENHGLFMGPAERTDVIVDLSGVPAGATLMLYNDSPAPVPGYDTRLDYYTGDPDQSDTGGAPSTLPGYGPNIRTVMQIHVTSGSTTAFNLSDLQTALPKMFAATQPAIIVPEKTYDSVAIGGVPAKNTYSRIADTSITYTPIGGSSTTKPLGSKAIHELFENDYGKMNSILGVELPLTSYATQTTIPLAYVDPPTEILKDGEVQFWKVTHNGVDSHAVHFHLVDVQLINRIGWDGAIRPPDANELGWKETVRMNPLEDVVVAMRPVKMTLPSNFPVGDSTRLLDPTRAENATNVAGMPGFTNIDPLTNNPMTQYNVSTNFGWEYVWHCHLLGHEESDMMRPLVFDVNAPASPRNLTGSIVSGGIQLNWQFTQGANTQAAFLKVQRAPLNGTFTDLTGATALSVSTTTYTDTSTPAQSGSWSYRLVAYNGNSLSGPSNVVSFVRLASPTNVTAPAATITTTQITLSWTAPNPATGVTGYVIQRSATQNGTYTQVGTSASLSYRNTGLTTKNTYWYRVQATGVGGAVSAFTTPISVTTK
jgi:FtsP/CotA-like multicopper oxidase with cupredoxin domain